MSHGRRRRRNLARTAGRGLALVLLGIPAAAWLLGWTTAESWFHGQRLKYSREPTVVGMPATPAGPSEAYSGPHPALSPRPAETFAFPIPVGGTGPVKPLADIPLIYPLVCMTEESDLGQPLVDNQAGEGVPVYADPEARSEVVGFSRDCSLATAVAYWYEASNGGFYRVGEGPGEPARIRLADGRETDFVLRVETGTINRHIYMIAALKGPDDQADRVDGRFWNRRLIYQFRGGVGIGRRQGRAGTGTFLGRRSDELTAGYAVAYSSANQTSNHYDMGLALDTMARVKAQFAGRYGEPEYTVGIGGSGGAIQQYLIAQNEPGLLDALIPLYSYPDMVTQVAYALDCELLEYYFDNAAQGRWSDWSRRRSVSGLNALDSPPDAGALGFWFLGLLQGHPPRASWGMSECVKSWRGLTPLVQNPRYVHFAGRFSPDIQRRVSWTYWSHMTHVYGLDEAGHGRSPWDNVGVQYGLVALRDGLLGPDEFVDINARIGGWKPAAEMQPERFWRASGAPSPRNGTAPWSEHNATALDGAYPAPRTRGDPSAAAAAALSGEVFLGLADVPIVDFRHYLEDVLDMHHAVASFQTRRRMQRAMGHAAHQVIWMSPANHAPMAEMLDLIDRWLANRRRNPGMSAAETRPPDAEDACFDAEGRQIASGPAVWDGAWNGQPDGPCTQRYPMHSTSRILAGEDYAGDRFACALKPVEEALTDGTYGAVDMRPWAATLRSVFPDGVCDYQADEPAARAVLATIREELGYDGPRLVAGE